MIEEIRKKLYELSEEDYKNFNQKLLPGVDRVLGIRLPALRNLAKEIAKDKASATGKQRGAAEQNVYTYLSEAKQEIGTDSVHEEIMLQGLVIGYAKMEKEERRKYLDEFVPKIQNWAVCDCCVTGYRFMEKEPDYWFDYLEQFAGSKEEFELRFMIVSMMSHFMSDKYIDKILGYCGAIRHEGYYARMGNAWAISVAYVKFPKKTRVFLENDELDDFTHNKAIQKIRESYRVSREEKDTLNLLKRR